MMENSGGKSEKQMTERRVAPKEKKKKEDKMEISRDLRLRRKKDVTKELRTANIRYLGSTREKRKNPQTP